VGQGFQEYSAMKALYAYESLLTKLLQLFRWSRKRLSKANLQVLGIFWWNQI